LIMIHGCGKPDAAENQRYARQHRYHGARQTDEDQARRKYIERNVRKAPSAAAAGDSAAWI
jgi:hypothetical protein